MNTHHLTYKIVMLAMVFGLLAAPAAFAEDRNDSPLIFIGANTDNANNNGLEAMVVSDNSGDNGRNLNADSPLSFMASYAGNEPEVVYSTTAALSEAGEADTISDFSIHLIKPDWQRDRVPGKDE